MFNNQTTLENTIKTSKIKVSGNFVQNLKFVIRMWPKSHFFHILIFLLLCLSLKKREPIFLAENKILVLNVIG